MQVFKGILAVIFIVGPCFYFGWKGQTVEMGIALAAGVFVTAFLNLDKLQKFKGAGIEVELKEAVKEAQATLENLKEFTTPLYIFSIKNMTEGQTWEGIPLNTQHEIIKKMELLHKNNQMEPSIKDAIEDFYFFNLYQYFHNIGELVNKFYNSEIETKFWALVDRDEKQYPSESKLRGVLNQLPNVEASEKLEKLISDYIYYKKYRYPRENS